MNIKKIVMVGLIAGMASFIVGSILYMNPMVSSIYSASSASYCAKSMELFGGLVPWLGLMWIGGLLSIIMLTMLYSYTEKGLVGPAWKKGLFFGLLLWLASGLFNGYNTWLLHSYPDIMILIELMNGLIGTLVAGIVMAIAYERIK